MGRTALQSLQLCMALAHGMGVHSQIPCSDAVHLPSCTAQLQEERRLRREAKRRWAMQRLYFARWRAEARRWVPCQATLLSTKLECITICRAHCTQPHCTQSHCTQPPIQLRLAM